MGIAGLNLKFNKKVKTNVERESIFIIKSHQTGPQTNGLTRQALQTNGKFFSNFGIIFRIGYNFLK